MKTILISGCNGFLGSHLMNFYFSKSEYEVIGLIRSTSNTFRINEVLLNSFIYKIDEVSLETIFNNHNIDIVINTVCNYGRSNDSYQDLLNSNFLFGKNLIDVSNNFNIRLFINTDTLLPNNINNYTKTKGLFRDYLKSTKFNLKIVNLRIDHMYGPGDDKNKFFGWFIHQIRHTDKSIELTSGEQKRDFIFIDDVVRAYDFIISYKFNFNLFNEYDLITNQFVKMKDLILLIIDKISKIDNKDYRSRLFFGAKKYRLNDVMIPKTNNFSLISIGWKPVDDLNTGLNKLLNNLNEFK